MTAPSGSPGEVARAPWNQLMSPDTRTSGRNWGQTEGGTHCDWCFPSKEAFENSQCRFRAQSWETQNTWIFPSSPHILICLHFYTLCVLFVLPGCSGLIPNCSGITPGDVWGPSVVLGIRLRSVACQACALISPAPYFRSDNFILYLFSLEPYLVMLKADS